MDAGADDIKEEEGGVEILCPIESFKSVTQVFEKTEIEADDIGLAWIPKEEMVASDELHERINVLIEALEELDDVKEVFTNI